MTETFSILSIYRDKLTFGITLKDSGEPSEDIILCEQVHGNEIQVFMDRPIRTPEGDALITNKKGLNIGVKVADCQGILLFDPQTQTIAAIHAGWKGAANKIIDNVIGTLKACYKVDTSNLLATVSPSLGHCCSEFTDPKSELPTHMHPYIEGNHVDLWKTVDDQLSKAGIPKENIERIKECTKCNKDKYYSHRNQHTGRMIVYIGLK